MALPQAGVLLARGVVQVPHRRRDISVAHPFLHPADVGLGDHPRPERVPQIVEAQRAQAGDAQRDFVATAKS